MNLFITIQLHNWTIGAALSCNRGGTICTLNLLLISYAEQRGLAAQK